MQDPNSDDLGACASMLYDQLSGVYEVGEEISREDVLGEARHIVGEFGFNHDSAQRVVLALVRMNRTGEYGLRSAKGAYTLQ